ncbi:MAG: hypothetical protein OXI95_15260 [bacterium]|nr:hypothetical protein [bacterium]
MTHDVEEAEHGRLRRPDPQPLVPVVVETAAVCELPLENDELARQAAVPNDRSMAPATATSAETAAGNDSGTVAAR